MPTFAEVWEACFPQALALKERLGRNPTRRELDDFAGLVSRHSQDFGLRRGPNTDFRFIRRQLCFALYNRSVHPDDVPRPLGDLPGELLEGLIHTFQMDYDRFWAACLHGCDFPPQPGEAWEWLVSCAINRRFGGSEWQAWLHSPVRWRHRHAPVEFYRMLVDE